VISCLEFGVIADSERVPCYWNTAGAEVNAMAFKGSALNMQDRKNLENDGLFKKRRTAAVVGDSRTASCRLSADF